MVWALDCGAIHVGSDGLALRPQWKLAAKTSHLQLSMGLDDVRDGISAACVAQLHRTYLAEGTSLVEVRFVQRVVAPNKSAT
jgi:hypothetical protein